MRKILSGLIPALVFILILSAPALAVPPGAGETGTISVFGEYGRDIDLGQAFIVGAGYTISDGHIVGLTVQNATYGMAYGLFANYNSDFLTVGVEYLIQGDDSLIDLHGTFLLDLDAAGICLNCGAIFTEGRTFYYIEGAADGEIGDGLTLYGGLGYLFDPGEVFYKIGVAYNF